MLWNKYKGIVLSTAEIKITPLLTIADDPEILNVLRILNSDNSPTIYGIVYYIDDECKVS